MHILVISDIHANLMALDAVIQDAGVVDGVWCLGDIVGYGPDPNECITRVRQLPGLVCVLGNHDAAMIDQIDLAAFNEDARLSIERLGPTLSEESREFLQQLPEAKVCDGITLVHGSPRNPVWEYILDTATAKRCFKSLATPYGFIGHTHVPVVFQLAKPEGKVQIQLLQSGDKLQLDGPAMLNPGSVGQPRDHNPYASYALFDTQEKTWENHRVFYDVLKVQRRIIEAKLPIKHALRLAEGW